VIAQIDRFPITAGSPIIGRHLDFSEESVTFWTPRDRLDPPGDRTIERRLFGEAHLLILVW